MGLLLGITETTVEDFKENIEKYIEIIHHNAEITITENGQEIARFTSIEQPSVLTKKGK